MTKLLKKMTKREIGMVLCSLIFIVAQVWLDLKMPEYMSTITMLVETPGSELSEIFLNGGYMLLCAVGSMAAAMVTGFFAAKVAAGLSKSLREQTFKKVMRFNSEEMGHFSTASLITRTTNDITQVQMLIAMGLQAIIKAPILLVWAILKIAGKQWQWSVATAGAVFIILAVLMVAVVLVLPKFQIIQTLTDNLNRVTRENLTGIRVVRAYNAERFQEEKFEKANAELTSANLFANRVMALLMPTMTFVTSGISLAIYWIGAYLINAAEMTGRLAIFSDMVVFSSYAMQVIMAFTMLTMMFIMLPRVMVSVRRINEVLDAKIKMENGTSSGGDLSLQGEVEFRNVSFRYPDAGGDVLKGISFTAHRGETVAFIGATGSGKSTLVNLIPRFYDVTEGEILVDGVDVRNYSQTALRNRLGYVSQRAVLFSGTVESNVSYGDNGQPTPQEDAIAEAVSMAQASEFVEKMDGGLSARIAQGGTNVSGGQKQRLSIARAICRRSEIYIFDDSFSALDYKTDRILRMALNQKLKDATKLIVAQRIGTIRNADKIIVLDAGKIAGMGTHDELMKSCSAYQEIARSQLSEEELANV